MAAEISATNVPRDVSYCWGVPSIVELFKNVEEGVDNSGHC